MPKTIVFLSGDENPIPVEQQDRRFMITEKNKHLKISIKQRSDFKQQFENIRQNQKFKSGLILEKK